MELKCPICGKFLVQPPCGIEDGKGRRYGKYFPFCSERCKLLDIGAWLDEKYKIETEQPE